MSTSVDQLKKLKIILICHHIHIQYASVGVTLNSTALVIGQRTVFFAYVATINVGITVHT